MATWQRFLLVGEDCRVRTLVERALAEVFSATRIIVADDADTATGLLGDEAVDCVVVAVPPHDRRWGELVRAVLRSKPELRHVPFLVFDGSKGRQRGSGAAGVYYG